RDDGDHHAGGHAAGGEPDVGGRAADRARARGCAGQDQAAREGGAGRLSSQGSQRGPRQGPHHPDQDVEEGFRRGQEGAGQRDRSVAAAVAGSYLAAARIDFSDFARSSAFPVPEKWMYIRRGSSWVWCVCSALGMNLPLISAVIAGFTSSGRSRSSPITSVFAAPPWNATMWWSRPLGTGMP